MLLSVLFRRVAGAISVPSSNSRGVNLSLSYKIVSLERDVGCIWLLLVPFPSPYGV